MMTSSVSTSDEGPVPLVHLAIGGVLDASTVASLRADTDRVVAARPLPVQIDLSGLTLIDSSGVAALLSLYKRLRAQERKVTVTGLRDQPLEIFRLLLPGGVGFALQ
jgi:anti-sigma B factor antagonist